MNFELMKWLGEKRGKEEWSRNGSRIEGESEGGTRSRKG